MKLDTKIFYADSLSNGDLAQYDPVSDTIYVTAQGMTAWLSSTGRPDARFTTSHLAQYNANPCQGAFNALVQLVRYFATTAKLAIRQELNVHSEWRLFSDSDMAGNGESINKRRSQLGSCALLGNAPITWSSKTSSVQFGEARLPAGFPSSITAVTAHRDIAGEHVATSSAEAETYALGVLAYQALTGQLPFQGETKPQVITAHHRHLRIPLRECCQISSALEALVEGLIAVKPEQRAAALRFWNPAC
jgi:hypothetical protein